jgi:hypothetical protein
MTWLRLGGMCYRVTVLDRKQFNPTFQTIYCMSLELHPKIHQKARTDNRIGSGLELYSLDLGTFRVALLYCYLQRFWDVHHSDSVSLSGTFNQSSNRCVHEVQL